MYIYELVQAIVIPAINGCDYDPDAVFSGITAYAHNNGFYELGSRFSEGVIRNIIKNNLSPILDMKSENIALFFSNFQLIERVRIINNQSLAIADWVRTGHEAAPDELQKIEAEFDDCMFKVCSIQGLWSFLNVQISEIVLNIDFVKGATKRFSQRLNSIEGGNR